MRSFRLVDLDARPSLPAFDTLRMACPLLHQVETVFKIVEGQSRKTTVDDVQLLLRDQGESTRATDSSASSPPRPRVSEGDGACRRAA